MSLCSYCSVTTKSSGSQKICFLTVVIAGDLNGAQNGGIF